MLWCLIAALNYSDWGGIISKTTWQSCTLFPVAFITGMLYCQFPIFIKISQKYSFDTHKKNPRWSRGLFTFTTHLFRVKDYLYLCYRQFKIAHWANISLHKKDKVHFSSVNTDIEWKQLGDFPIKEDLFINRVNECDWTEANSG